MLCHCADSHAKNSEAEIRKSLSRPRHPRCAPLFLKRRIQQGSSKNGAGSKTPARLPNHGIEGPVSCEVPPLENVPKPSGHYLAGNRALAPPRSAVATLGCRCRPHRRSPGGRQRSAGSPPRSPQRHCHPRRSGVPRRRPRSRPLSCLRQSPGCSCRPPNCSLGCPRRPPGCRFRPRSESPGCLRRSLESRRHCRSLCCPSALLVVGAVLVAPVLTDAVFAAPLAVDAVLAVLLAVKVFHETVQQRSTS